MGPAPPAGMAKVADWIRDFPTQFQDANGGVMNDMMSLAVRYFGHVERAAGNDKEATPVLEMLELQKMFSLLIDSDSDLDQRLYDDPAVRDLVVSNLLTPILVLSTGISLFVPEYKQTLIKDTNRILEQASIVAHRHLQRKPSCAPVSFVEFCNSTKDIIRSSLENVYELLPTTRHLVQDFGESERQQYREIGHYECVPFSDRRITQGCQRLCRPGRSNVTPASDSSIISKGARNRRRSHSDSSKSSQRRSYNSTKSPSTSPLFSDTRTHDSAHALTDTVTSNSQLEVGSSSITPTSNSSRTSSSCKRCRTTFSDLSELEAHLCRTSKIARLRRKIRAWVSRSPSRKIDPQQLVTVWHGDGQSKLTKRVMILDSGTYDNFILRSTVEELELEVRPRATTRIKGLGGRIVEASEFVKPKWQFGEGSIRHQEVDFLIVPEIPGGFDMVLGSIACGYLGLYFRLDPGYALVAHADHEGKSTSAQHQQQYGRQRRDGDAEMAKIRQDIEARHRDLFRQREAANAASKTKTQAPTSQKYATRSADNHG